MVSKGKYAFHVEHEIDYIEDESKICNVGYFEENGFVNFYGSLLRLFGKPQYSSEDFESSFMYIIKAKESDGEEVLLWTNRSCDWRSFRRRRDTPSSDGIDIINKEYCSTGL